MCHGKISMYDYKYRIQMSNFRLHIFYLEYFSAIIMNLKVCHTHRQPWRRWRAVGRLYPTQSGQ